MFARDTRSNLSGRLCALPLSRADFSFLSDQLREWSSYFMQSFAQEAAVRDIREVWAERLKSRKDGEATQTHKKAKMKGNEASSNKSSVKVSFS